MGVDRSCISQDLQFHTQGNMRAHHGPWPIAGRKRSQCFPDSFRWCNSLEYPADNPQRFRRSKAISFTLAPYARLVKPVVVERLGDVSDPSLKSHRGPKLPTAALAEAFVCSSDTLIDRLSKNNRAGIWNRIGTHEILLTFLSPVRKKIGFLP